MVQVFECSPHKMLKCVSKLGRRVLGCYTTSSKTNIKKITFLVEYMHKRKGKTGNTPTSRFIG